MTATMVSGRLRCDCPNEHWFLNLVDVQEKLDAWRDDYNRERPHGALKNLTRTALARQVAQTMESAPTADGQKTHTGAPGQGPGTLLISMLPLRQLSGARAAPGTRGLPVRMVFQVIQPRIPPLASRMCCDLTW